MTKRLKPVMPVTITLKDNEWEAIIFSLEWGQPHGPGADLIATQLRKAQGGNAICFGEAEEIPLDEAPGNSQKMGA
jgi:hypothetical protein